MSNREIPNHIAFFSVLIAIGVCIVFFCAAWDQNEGSTLPDDPSLSRLGIPVRDGDLDHTILLPIETANELLKLIGEDPIPQNPLFGS